jgi:hypothetical protein
MLDNVPRGQERAWESGELLHPEAIVRESSPPGTARRRPQRSARRCDPADRVLNQDVEAEAFSFVVRIWKRAGSANAECRGWVEHVQSGQRTFFLGLDELSSVIATHIGVPARRRGRWRDRLARWRTHVAGWFARE